MGNETEKRLNERLNKWNTSKVRNIRKDTCPYLFTATEREELVGVIMDELNQIQKEKEQSCKK